MGGNAIKNARRIGKDEFFQICHELQDIFPELKMKPVKAYFQKDDFGDIDMIVETQPNLNIEKMVRDRLSPVDEYTNGPYYSFEYKGVQVDFIKTSPQYFLSTLNYMHWNDIGNFFGRVARGLNFKYGSDGLSYEYHIDDHYKISVNITTDSAKALEFLGYDSKVWLNGFNSKDDIFKFVTTSKFFNAQYFTLAEQAHADRVRNRKRKMYQSMLEYIAEKGIEPRPKLTEAERLVEYNRAREVFGDSFHIQVELAKAKYAKSQTFKNIYNGDIVSKLTGLSGKELGKFMSYLKEQAINEFGFNDSEDFMDEVINGGEDYVTKFVVVSFFNSFKPHEFLEYSLGMLDILDKLKNFTPVYNTVSQSSGLANAVYITNDGIYNTIYDIYGKIYVAVNYVLFKNKQPCFL